MAAAALTVPSRAEALQPLSQFLRAAATESPERREAILTAEQRESEASQSWGRLFPAFIARASYTRNQRPVEIALPAQPGATPERIVITPRDQLDAILTLEVPIIDVVKWKSIAATGALADAAKARANATKLDVDRMVAERYYQIVAADALIAAAGRSLAVAKENERVAKERKAAGAVADLEVDRATADVERANQSIADAELLKAVARRAVESLTRIRPTGGSPELNDDLREEQPLRTWENTTAERQPLVRAAELESRAAAQQSDLARAALFPTVMATATERLTNATGFQGNVGTWTLALTASIRLDVTSVQAIGAVDKAAASAKAREERTRRVARDQVHDAWHRVRAQIAKSRAARAQARAAIKASAHARDRYQSGAATQLEVIQAERDAFAADVARIQADADLAYARALLRLSAGVPLVK